jgi:hypothetical protein
MAHITIYGSKSAAHLNHTDYLVRGIPQAIGFTFLGFFEPYLVWKPSPVQESLGWRQHSDSRNNRTSLPPKPVGAGWVQP